tara:strand:+ start:823 stop:1761 length:939 start_codon:yes stop_codon:yes gene_type:complete
MSYKVLVTCPPMIKQIEKFEGIFKEKEFEITVPDFIQTLSEEELIEIVPQHHGWIIGDDPATRRVFESGKAGRLLCAVKWGIGTDNIDFNACKELSIPIINTPGVFGNEVADLAMCYVLGLARDAFYVDREVRSGKWVKPTGMSLVGKTMGIIGLGDIGRNIAIRANAHKLEITGWDPVTREIPEFINRQDSWPTGIETCDFLVFACALNKNNFHMFNDSILENIKPGLRIINISRGQLIDEGALIKGLKNKTIASAALDVFEKEPLTMDNEILNYQNCILGSHNASNTFEAVMRASDEAISKLHKMLKEEC